MPGMEFGAAASGEQGSLHRLGHRGAAAQHPLPGLQHALSNSAVGLGSAPGFAHSGPYGPSDIGGLGAHLRASDLLSGNLHRPGAISRDLLSGGELDGAGENHGPRQGRSDASGEPVDQRSARPSSHAAVSGVITTTVSKYEGR